MDKRLLERLEGIQTIETIMKNLNVKRKTAIDYVSILKKKGYVKTKQVHNHKRVYYIEFENKLGGQSYIELINKYSPIKISENKIYKIYGKRLTIEETLINAIESKSPRIILASLILFQKIKNWKKLYQLAKEKEIKREVGALYDLTRKIMKTRKMNLRYLSNSLPKKGDKFKEIIPYFKSKDFNDIENRWKVYLPFNKADLGEYK